MLHNLANLDRLTLNPLPFRRFLLLLGLGVSGWPITASRAAIVLTVKQIGPDVVVVGSGSANTSGLTLHDTDTDYQNVLGDSQIYAGPAVYSDLMGGGGDVKRWSGLSGSITFGSDPGVFEYPSSGTNDLFGIAYDYNISESLLVLPLSYVSSTPLLESTTTYTSTSLSQLGLSPGVFTWTWDTGSNIDSLKLEIEAVAVPGSLPLVGGAVAWRFARRLRKAGRKGFPQNQIRSPINR